MTAEVTVHKLNAWGEEVWQYPGHLLARNPDRACLMARFDLDRVSMGGLTIERGDRFVETYYFDRWYNIFAIYEPTGNHLKGWYCNIARPARLTGMDLYAEDLALDIIVLPTGEVHILDREEFEALPLPPDDRQRALRALDDLLGMIRARRGPFASGSGGSDCGEIRPSSP